MNGSVCQPPRPPCEPTSSSKPVTSPVTSSTEPSRIRSPAVREAREATQRPRRPGARTPPAGRARRAASRRGHAGRPRRAGAGDHRPTGRSPPRSPDAAQGRSIRPGYRSSIASLVILAGFVREVDVGEVPGRCDDDIGRPSGVRARDLAPRAPQPAGQPSREEWAEAGAPAELGCDAPAEAGRLDRVGGPLDGHRARQLRRDHRLERLAVALLEASHPGTGRGRRARRTGMAGRCTGRPCAATRWPDRCLRARRSPPRARARSGGRWRRSRCSPRRWSAPRRTSPR